MSNRQSSDKGKKPRRHIADRFLKWIHSSSCICTLMFLGAALIVYLVFFTICSPKKYDLKVGAISHVNINATKDVIDEVSTEEKRIAAENAVEPTYHFVEGVKEDVLSSLGEVFNQLRTVQQYGLTLRDPDSSEPKQSFTEEETDYAIGLVDMVLNHKASSPSSKK